VGGCDELYALDEAGALDPLLAAAKEEAAQEKATKEKSE